MGSGTHKLKVVWICHFSNAKIRKQLKIKKGNDFAPWITLLIEQFENFKDIDLYVISPHHSLFRDITYSNNGINYFFIKTGIPYVNKNWPNFFKYDYWTKYRGYSKKIEKIVRNINPDIINLHGAENPYYSKSILYLMDYPVLVNIQGIFTLITERRAKTKYEVYRSKIENLIYSQFKHFGIRAEFMRKYIQSMNPDAHFYEQFYPIKNTFEFKQPKKVYDIVFFARIVKEKGIEDLLEALSLLKKDIPKIKACIIGPGEKHYVLFLKKKIVELDLVKNIVFKGVLSTQNEVHFEAAKAKICVLPTYNDTMPGTIIESLFLGLPVVSYPVGAIPKLNKDEDVVLLAEKENIPDLAKKVYFLLKDNKYLSFKQDIKNKVNRNFDNTKLAKQLISFYNKITPVQ